MTPEERQEFEDMKNRLRQIEDATNPAFIGNLSRRTTLPITLGASTAGTSVAVRNAADTGSETVAEQFNGIFTITFNGVNYRIGYY